MGSEIFGVFAFGHHERPILCWCALALPRAPAAAVVVDLGEMHVAELVPGAGLVLDAAARRLSHALPADFCTPSATTLCPAYSGDGLSQQSVTAISLALVAAAAVSGSVVYGVYVMWCKKDEASSGRPGSPTSLAVSL